MADTIIQTVLDKDYASLKDGLEQVVATKIHRKIQEMKPEILADINKIDKGKMAEILATAASSQREPAEPAPDPANSEPAPDGGKKDEATN